LTDISVRYYLVEPDKVKDEEMEGLSTQDLFKYLRPRCTESKEEFPANTKVIDLHERGVFDIDLSTMKDFPNLKQLVLGYNTFMYLDLSPLKDCPNLEELYFDRCMLEEMDLAPLENCKKLRLITFRGNGLSKIDISGLSGCPKLEWLELPHNLITQITQMLESLIIDDVKIDEPDQKLPSLSKAERGPRYWDEEAGN